MSDWGLIENPSYAGQQPRRLKAACHDKTPCIDVVCAACGGYMHIHESQIAGAPDDAEVATRCKGCGVPLIFPPGYFQAAFAQLRAEGWVE